MSYIKNVQETDFINPDLPDCGDVPEVDCKHEQVETYMVGDAPSGLVEVGYCKQCGKVDRGQGFEGELPVEYNGDYDDNDPIFSVEVI